MSMKAANILGNKMKSSREDYSLPQSVFHVPALNVFYLSLWHVMLLRVNPETFLSAALGFFPLQQLANPHTEKVSITITSRPLNFAQRDILPCTSSSLCIHPVCRELYFFFF